MQYNSYIPPMVRVADTRTAGIHMIDARLTFSDGSQEVLSLEIDVTP